MVQFSTTKSSVICTEPDCNKFQTKHTTCCNAPMCNTHYNLISKCSVKDCKKSLIKMCSKCADKNFNWCNEHEHTFCKEHNKLYLQWSSNCAQSLTIHGVSHELNQEKMQLINMCSSSPTCSYCEKSANVTPCCGIKLCERHWKKWIKPKCSIIDCDNKERQVCKNCTTIRNNQTEDLPDTGIFCIGCRTALCSVCKKIFQCLC